MSHGKFGRKADAYEYRQTALTPRASSSIGEFGLNLSHRRRTSRTNRILFVLAGVILSVALPFGNSNTARAKSPAAGPCTTNDGKPCVVAGQKCARNRYEQNQTYKVGPAVQVRTFTCVKVRRNFRWKELDTGYVLTWTFYDFNFKYITDGYPLQLDGVACTVRFAPSPIRYTIPGFAQMDLGVSCGARVKNLSDVYDLPYTPRIGYRIFLMRDLGIDPYGSGFDNYMELGMTCNRNCWGIPAGQGAQFGDGYWRSLTLAGTREAIEGLYGDLLHPSRREGLANLAFEVFGIPGWASPEGCFLFGSESSTSRIRSGRLEQFDDANICDVPEIDPVW